MGIFDRFRKEPKLDERSISLLAEYIKKGREAISNPETDLIDALKDLAYGFKISKGSTEEEKYREYVLEIIGAKIANQIKGFASRKDLEAQIKSTYLQYSELFYSTRITEYLKEEEISGSAFELIKGNIESQRNKAFHDLVFDPLIFKLISAYNKADGTLETILNGKTSEIENIRGMPASKGVYKLGAEYALLNLSYHIENQRPIILASTDFYAFYEQNKGRINSYSEKLDEKAQEEIKEKIERLELLFNERIEPWKEKIEKAQDKIYDKAEQFAEAGDRERFEKAFDNYKGFTLRYSRILEEKEEDIEKSYQGFIENYFTQKEQKEGEGMQFEYVTVPTAKKI